MTRLDFTHLVQAIVIAAAIIIVAVQIPKAARLAAEAGAERNAASACKW